MGSNPTLSAKYTSGISVHFDERNLSGKPYRLTSSYRPSAITAERSSDKTVDPGASLVTPPSP